MGLGAAIGSMGFAWIVGGASGVGAEIDGADFISTAGAETFLATLVADLVATFLTVLDATFFAAFLAGVFFTAAFFAFVGLAPVGSSRKSSVLFWLIRSMFGKRGVVEFLIHGRKGKMGRLADDMKIYG